MPASTVSSFGKGSDAISIADSRLAFSRAGSTSRGRRIVAMPFMCAERLGGAGNPAQCSIKGLLLPLVPSNRDPSHIHRRTEARLCHENKRFSPVWGTQSYLQH